MPHHDPPQLFLIDGYALVYRAFFAMIARPLRTSKGANTSAAWGVANFLLRLRERYQPDYLAWIHDAGDSFRTDQYPDYKSTREKLDDELQADFDQAIEHVEALLDAFRVPLVEVEGYEADDVIGTLAEKADEHDLQVVIVSGDKDFYQLIGPRIALLNPGRRGPAAVDEQWVDESNAADRLGVPPRQVVDYLALVGDSSDNVPGVKGIGDKGARELLSQYTDLEDLLAHAAEVKKKRPREALESQGDNARLSRDLVTIRRDVPVELDLERFHARSPDNGALTSILAELEFFALARKLGLESEPSITPVEGKIAQHRVTVVDEVGDLDAVVARLRAAPLVALDVRGSASSPRDGTLVGIALATSLEEAWYLPFAHEAAGGELAAPAAVANLPPLTDPACRAVLEVLSDPAIPKAGHDLKRDWQVLRQAGVELAGVSFDTMIASFVLDPGRRSHAMENLSLEHLAHTLRSHEDVVGKGKKATAFAAVGPGVAGEYSGSRSITVLALHQVFRPFLERMAAEPLFHDIEMPLVGVLVDMEWTGIRIDTTLLAKLGREFREELTTLVAEIHVAAGQEFNLNSPKQLAAVLFEKQQLPILKKTKTGASTDADVLEQLAAMGHDVPRLILEHRELQKLLSTYVDVLPDAVNPTTGRIHTTFNQTGAATGRLSSSDPNLQNIPVRSRRGEVIRRGFVPDNGWVFLVADYSQIELRLMAHLSQDPAFIEAFRRGGDIHGETAAIIFDVPANEVTSDMRARAKTINFATIYGQGPFALGKQLDISQQDAKAFISAYFERFAGVRTFLDRQIELARSQGYVETLFGRRRYIPEIKDKNFNVRAFGERTAQNSPLQGSAADLIKRAMIRIHECLRSDGLRAQMLLQVHDELVLEAPKSEVDQVRTLVKREMESAADLSIPLVVEVGVGPNWLDAKT
ncbi:MAG: DNA polymerase I [Gemmatimonadales bacterium]|nr:DNA polymerase I [Gemmatimonadales bacterium]